MARANPGIAAAMGPPLSSPSKLSALGVSAPSTPQSAKRKLDAATPDEDARKRKGRTAAPAVDRGGKGLRHFSLLVCQKVKEKGVTSYNEVADELVRDHQAVGDQPEVDEDGVELHGPKNIRRRVYDALNVLMAMNIIAKDRKDIRWLGLPTTSATELADLQAQRAARTARIEEKRRRLHELLLQQIAFKSLLRRNEQAAAAPDQRVQLPFIVVQTARDAAIQCQMTEDKTEYVFEFDQPFSVHDDVELLKRLGFSQGIDDGTATEEQLEMARSMVPQALQSHVTELYEARRAARLASGPAATTSGDDDD